MQRSAPFAAVLTLLLGVCHVHGKLADFCILLGKVKSHCEDTRTRAQPSWVFAASYGLTKYKEHVGPPLDGCATYCSQPIMQPESH